MGQCSGWQQIATIGFQPLSELRRISCFDLLDRDFGPGDVLLGAEIALPAPVIERGILRDPCASGRLVCRRKVRHDAVP